MVAEVVNNPDDPVTNCLWDPFRLISVAWGDGKCHDYAKWDYEKTSPAQTRVPVRPDAWYPEPRESPPICCRGPRTDPRSGLGRPPAQRGARRRRRPLRRHGRSAEAVRKRDQRRVVRRARGRHAPALPRDPDGPERAAVPSRSGSGDRSGPAGGRGEVRWRHEPRPRDRGPPGGTAPAGAAVRLRSLMLPPLSRFLSEVAFPLRRHAKRAPLDGPTIGEALREAEALAAGHPPHEPAALFFACSRRAPAFGGAGAQVRRSPRTLAKRPCTPASGAYFAAAIAGKLASVRDRDAPNRAPRGWVQEASFQVRPSHEGSRATTSRSGSLASRTGSPATGSGSGATGPRRRPLVPRALRLEAGLSPPGPGPSRRVRDGDLSFREPSVSKRASRLPVRDLREGSETAISRSESPPCEAGLSPPGPGASRRVRDDDLPVREPPRLEAGARSPVQDDDLVRCSTRQPFAAGRKRQGHRPAGSYGSITLPGFIRFAGSRSLLIPFIRASSSGERE